MLANSSLEVKEKKTGTEKEKLENKLKTETSIIRMAKRENKEKRRRGILGKR